MSSSKSNALAIWLAVGVAGPVFADWWGLPDREHWSANGRLVLRVEWELESKLALWRNEDGKSYEVWSRGYIERRPPHKAYVSDDGRCVVLRDMHGRLGKGKVLVFLGENGEIIRSHELRDILTEYQRLQPRMTVSSIWWSEPGWFSFRNDDRQFAFVTHKGVMRCYETKSGNQIQIDDKLRTEIVDEARESVRAMLSSKEAKERAAGATLLGVLKDEFSVPRLKELLADTAGTGMSVRVGGGFAPICTVQLASSRALTQIIGAEALPLITKHLDVKNEHMLNGLLDVMADLDRDERKVVTTAESPAIRAFWEALTHHESRKVRENATWRVLERDDCTFLRKHPELIESRHKAIRRAAIRTLSEHATSSDIGLLRQALNDKDELNRAWAWKGLVRLSPPDIDEILEWGGGPQLPSHMKFTVVTEKARRGDEDAIEKVIQVVREMASHEHKEKCRGVSFSTKACAFVADARLMQAKPALRAAMANPCPRIQRAACVPLAVLGDDDALEFLRRSAREGRAIDRSSAIAWLGRVGDRESIEMLKEASEHEEKWIKDAACKALAELKRRQ